MNESVRNEMRRRFLAGAAGAGAVAALGPLKFLWFN